VEQARISLEEAKKERIVIEKDIGLEKVAAQKGASALKLAGVRFLSLFFIFFCRHRGSSVLSLAGVRFVLLFYLLFC
jgi:hypothetical protein